MNKLYLLIAGGRDFTDYEVLKVSLTKETEGNELPIVVISGTAKGADTLGEKWAQECGHKIIRYRPEWSKYGNKAGPLRNVEMYNFIKEQEHRKVIVFWDGCSKGTMHMIRISMNGIVPLSIYKYNGELM